MVICYTFHMLYILHIYITYMIRHLIYVCAYIYTYEMYVSIYTYILLWIFVVIKHLCNYISSLCILINVDHRFSKFNMNQNRMEDMLKHRLLGLSPEFLIQLIWDGWLGPKICIFNKFRMMPMPLFWELLSRMTYRNNNINYYL